MRMTPEKLTDVEKSEMLEALRSYMGMHETKIPYRLRMQDSLSAAGMGMVRFMALPQRYGAVAVILIMISGGVGTSYFAEGALPGDFLYNIKVNINEPVAAALQSNLQNHALYEAELASRRLQEAETLAARNRLTPATTAIITSHLAQATTAFNADSTQFATSTYGNIAVIASVQSRLDAIFSAHEQVMAALSDTLPMASSSLQSVSKVVTDYISREKNYDNRIDAAFVPTSNNQLLITAKQSRRTALVALDQIAALSKKTSIADGSDGASDASSSTARIQQTLNSGDAYLQYGSTTQAVASFQSAASQAFETQTVLDATQQLRTILPNFKLSSRKTLYADLNSAIASSSIPAGSLSTTSPVQSYEHQKADGNPMYNSNAGE